METTIQRSDVLQCTMLVTWISDHDLLMATNRVDIIHSVHCELAHRISDLIMEKLGPKIAALLETPPAP